MFFPLGAAGKAHYAVVRTQPTYGMRQMILPSCPLPSATDSVLTTTQVPNLVSIGSPSRGRLGSSISSRSSRFGPSTMRMYRFNS